MSATHTFSFAFAITAPIFIMVLLGIILTRVKMINDGFIATASRLVFNLGLPTMLFMSSATTDFSHLADMRLMVALGAMTLLVFLAVQLTARWQVRVPRDQGVLVQGAFRGNLVITGLAFCANAYGERGLAMAALPVAVTVIIYNVLSVYTLQRSLSENQRGSLRNTLLGVIRNPLIIAIVAGLLFNLAGLTLPQLLRDSGNYLGRMVLPLALICIGGSLNLKHLRQLDYTVLAASLWKLIISPILACAIALTLGIRGEGLVILFLLAASPTATVSFVMVHALGGNEKLAANIVMQTTLLSLVTVTLGLWFLQVTGWG